MRRRFLQNKNSGLYLSMQCWSPFLNIAITSIVFMLFGKNTYLKEDIVYYSPRNNNLWTLTISKEFISVYVWFFFTISIFRVSSIPQRNVVFLPLKISNIFFSPETQSFYWPSYSQHLENNCWTLQQCLLSCSPEPLRN